MRDSEHMKPTRTLLEDAALAAVVAVVGVVGTAGADNLGLADRPVDAWAFALVLGAAMALVGRRQRPLLTLAVVTVLVSAYLVSGYPYGPIFLPFLVAVYTMASHRPPARSAPAALAALAGLLPHVLTHEGSLSGFAALIPVTAWVVVPYAVGATVRLNRQAVARERAETVRQRVYDERLRVAQEVHDVVGHGLAAIKMQADIALHLLPKKPDQAESALTAISRTSTEALDELRTTLAAVRWTESNAARSPVSGMDRLDDLRRRMSAAGLRVDVEITALPARRRRPRRLSDRAGVADKCAPTWRRDGCQRTHRLRN